MDWTHLPFIFGVWIARREAAARQPEAVAEACRALVRAKDWSAARPELVARLAAEKGGFDEAAMRTYFEGLVYDFGPREQEGLTVFFSMLRITSYNVCYTKLLRHFVTISSPYGLFFQLQYWLRPAVFPA